MDFLLFICYVLMSVKLWNVGFRNVLIGKVLIGLMLYLFFVVGVGFFVSRFIVLFVMLVLKLEL